MSRVSRRKNRARIRSSLRAISSVFIILFASLLGGCISHDVQLQDANYSIAATGGIKAADLSVVVVIDAATMARKTTIQSWMTGIANKWETEPGLMMKDVVDIEFPQAFGSYERVQNYAEPKVGGRRLTVELTIPSYDFADFHASITVRAVTYGAGKNKLLDKTYTAEGFKQGAKMFWGGAFAMKSALRQSSLDAYKKIFAELRQDLQHLSTPAPP